MRPGLNVIGTECYEPASGETSPISPEFIPTLEATATPFMIELPILATVMLFESQSTTGEGQFVEPKLQGRAGE